jgi:hypothetical protein
MRDLTVALALLVAGSLGATRTDYLTVKQKFQQIERKQAKPGTRIPISSQELNAYVENELPLVAPKGIRKPRVDLQGNDTATGSALIDFVKLRSAQGKSTNWLLRKMLEGEREVKVTTRVTSGGGIATVDLERVEIGGLPIQGAALDFIIKNYLIPNYPNAKIGRPFKLHKQVDRIDVEPGMAYVTLKR